MGGELVVSELSVHTPRFSGVFSEQDFLEGDPECTGSGHQEKEKRVFYNRQRERHAKRTYMQESSSFHGGQEAGNKTGRAQVQEITQRVLSSQQPSTRPAFLIAHSAMNSSMDQATNLGTGFGHRSL